MPTGTVGGAGVVPLGLRILDGAWADRVPSPAYDALTPAERRAWIAAHPDSYLAVTQGPEDQPALPHEDLLADSRSTLDRLVERGAFGPLRPAGYYVLRLDWQGRTHDAIVGGIAVADITGGGLRLHEKVRPERAEHLARHLVEVGVQSSPLHVAHHPDPVLRSIIGRVAATRPLVTVRADDGLTQTVWAVPAGDTAEIGDRLSEVALYLIDGHHRTAAAVAHRRLVGPGRADRVLAAVYDADDLDNRAHHRLLHLGDETESFLDRLDERHGVRVLEATGRSDDPALVGRSDSELALYHRGRWHLLDVPFRSDPIGWRSPAERLADLDPVRLQRVLDAILGSRSDSHSTDSHSTDSHSTDSHSTDYDHRLRFRPGTEPVTALLAEADAGDDVLALLRPVAVPDLLAVAEAGLVMPPKSTYFVPKARSGVFVRPVLDDHASGPAGA